MKQYCVLVFDITDPIGLQETIDQLNRISAEQGYKVCAVLQDPHYAEQYLLIEKDVPEKSK